MKNTITLHYRALLVALHATGIVTPTPQPRSWLNFI